MNKANFNSVFLGAEQTRKLNYTTDLSTALQTIVGAHIRHAGDPKTGENEAGNHEGEA